MSKRYEPQDIEKSGRRSGRMKKPLPPQMIIQNRNTTHSLNFRIRQDRDFT